jgi:branched-chain amino acid transport system permease protein
LREDYLAITLLAFAEIINAIATAYKPFLGGAFGIQVPSVYGWAGEHRFTVATLAILVIAALSYLYAEYLERTPLGRTFESYKRK